MADRQINQHLALEMTMQDVLGNMEELTLGFAFCGSAGCFEILAIEPTEIPEAMPVSRSMRVRSPYEASVLQLTANKLVRVA